MKALKQLFLLMMLLVASVALRAQDDVEMAEYYYNQGQYEQARLYYEKVYKQNKTTKVYTNYLNTLVALSAYEEAEKVVKKHIKTDGDDGVGYIQLGDLYKRINRPEDAKEQFELAVRKTSPTRVNIVRLANEFARINEFQYALKAYEKGKANAQDDYTFTYEIANMQGNLGDYDAMTESFLDLIVESPAYVQSVQNSLNRTLNFEENAANMEMLKTKLLKRVQKSPDQSIFSEMLIWLFMQKRDFASALVQASGLDKRLNENGSRIISLAETAASNKDYTTSKKAYQYVLDKGKENPYYLTARIEKLHVMTKELSEQSRIDKLSYAALESDYLLALNELGKRAETAMMMKDLGHIQAFYLDKMNDAIAVIQEAIVLPGLVPRTQAICKLELGDIQVFKGEVWEASLLFSQVELDFKEDPLGAEAKFRNARISYFTGDFEWAQGQLDALKASTSKLISNDAIDLSLLITDNFNMDTILVPMQMYARADLLRYQNKFELAEQTLDSLTKEFPFHSLSDEVMMMKADMCLKQGLNDKARDYYQKVVEIYSTDITADDALFNLAEMYERVYQDTPKAMELYEKVLTAYPGSLYVVEARKRFRQLRGDNLN
jgi:tetratricopeptide (TPR) repeat protein